MKNFKLSLTVLLSIIVMSCSSDDENSSSFIEPVITAPAIPFLGMEKMQYLILVKLQE